MRPVQWYAKRGGPLAFGRTVASRSKQKRYPNDAAAAQSKQEVLYLLQQEQLQEQDKNVQLQLQ